MKESKVDENVNDNLMIFNVIIEEFFLIYKMEWEMKQVLMPDVN